MSSRQQVRPAKTLSKSIAPHAKREMEKTMDDRPIYVHITRYGYLATLLMRARPAASWDEIDAALNRIVHRGETQNEEERLAMEAANRSTFEEPQFPVAHAA